jgi:hypothetical protein
MNCFHHAFLGGKQVWRFRIPISDRNRNSWAHPSIVSIAVFLRGNGLMTSGQTRYHGHAGHAISLFGTGFLRRDGTGPVQSWSRLSIAATPANELFPPRYSFRPVVPTNELFPIRFPSRQAGLVVQTSDFSKGSELLIGPIHCLHRGFPSRQRAHDLWAGQVPWPRRP